MNAFLVVSFGADERRLSADRSLVLGRGPECDLRFDDPHLSRKHARVSCDDGILHVDDLGSRNGILVNGAPTSRAVLHDGDVIVAGSVVIKCEADSSSRPAPPVPSSASAPRTRVVPRLAPATLRPVPPTPAAPKANPLRALVKGVFRAQSSAPDRGMSGAAFRTAWRRQLLVAWLVGAIAVAAWPTWYVASQGDRHGAQVAVSAARWLAAEAHGITDPASLEQLAREAMSTVSLAGVSFRDAGCEVIAPASQMKASPTEINCPRTPEASTRQTGVRSIAIAPVPTVTPSAAAWVVVEVSAQQREVGDYFLGLIAALGVASALVWGRSALLFDRIVEPVDAFADAAGAALSGGRLAFAPEPGPQGLHRLAEVLAFLVAERERNSGISRERTTDTARRVSAASVPATPVPPPPPPQPEGSTPMTQARLPQASCLAKVGLTLSAAFILQGLDGAAEEFGIHARVGAHVLDVFGSNPALLQPVLDLLTRCARTPGESSTDCQASVGAVQVVVRSVGTSYAVSLLRPVEVSNAS